MNTTEPTGNPYANPRAGYYTLGILTVVYSFNFIDRQLLREHEDCADFHVIDDVSFSTIDKQVGLYYRSGKQLNDSASGFVALCEQHWSL